MKKSFASANQLISKSLWSGLPKNRRPKGRLLIYANLPGASNAGRLDAWLQAPR